MNRRLPACALSLSLLAEGTPCSAESQPGYEPLWELGLFNFVATLPYYRGSDQTKVYAFPLPYLVYRGERVRANREGVRGIFYQDSRFETSLSLSGNPPVDNDAEAREGMPDLDAIGEIGPAVKWYFLGREPLDKLYLQASVRAAASVSFDSGAQVVYRGIVGGLDLVYANRSRFRDQHLRFRVAAGLNLGNQGYHGYFYDVAPTYATPARPAYSAEAGYGGTSLSFSMQYDMTPALSLGFYSRWDNSAGAVFADSPLVRQEQNFVVGVALIVRALSSHTLVPAEEFD